MLVAVGHLQNSVVNLALFSDCNDLFHGRIWVSIAEVELKSVVEEDTVLGNNTDVLSKRVKFEFFNILSINYYVTSLRVINAE
jgi:hypothetical protein